MQKKIAQQQSIVLFTANKKLTILKHIHLPDLL